MLNFGFFYWGLWSLWKLVMRVLFLLIVGDGVFDFFCIVLLMIFLWLFWKLCIKERKIEFCYFFFCLCCIVLSSCFVVFVIVDCFFVIFCVLFFFLSVCCLLRERFVILGVLRFVRWDLYVFFCCCWVFWIDCVFSCVFCFVVCLVFFRVVLLSFSLWVIWFMVVFILVMLLFLLVVIYFDIFWLKLVLVVGCWVVVVIGFMKLLFVGLYRGVIELKVFWKFWKWVGCCIWGCCVGSILFWRGDRGVCCWVKWLKFVV